MSACFWASFACDQLRPTARRVMRSKSKCGSTFCSASSTTFVRLPDWTSLSDLMTASTSSATRFTRASGVSCANAAAGRRSARHIARMRNMAGNLWDFGEPDSTSTRGPRSGALFLRLFLRLAEEELPDELLEHHCRLRDGDAVAGGELLVVAARVEPDVGLAQQPGREDGGARVLGPAVALVESEHDGRLEVRVVEADLGHAPDE